jgi:serine/threonine protein kinase
LGHDCSRFYAAELVDGIEGLHAAGVIHRNLKPEHILIDREGHIVICGFGNSGAQQLNLPRLTFHQQE